MIADPSVAGTPIACFGLNRAYGEKRKEFWMLLDADDNRYGSPALAGLEMRHVIIRRVVETEDLAIRSK